MRKVLLVILIVFFGSVIAQKPSVQLILDVSGSMWLNLESGDTKIDAAKTVLIDFIGGLPSDSLNMGLRLYGATVSGIDAGACTDSQLVIPIDGLNKGGLINTVQSTDPKGGTPIVYALSEAIKDFDAVPDDAQKLIILVTDGAESCGEDLDVAVQAVKANGIDLQVIGFGLAEKAANTFESTGAFANAMSALELATVLQETTVTITMNPTPQTPTVTPIVTTEITLCDELGSHPSDPNNPQGIQGVLWGDIDIDAALSACQDYFFSNLSNARAQYLYGRLSHKDRDYNTALKWYRQSANQGYAPAQAGVGIMYHNGLSVSRSYESAAEWYRKAIEQNFAPAQTNLGRLYLKGLGVEKNSTKAVEFFQLSANQGEPSGQYFLGLMYANGSGVEKDFSKAVELYQLAADQGDEDAIEALKKLQ